jgi:chromatin remodeling complex protein RSC6
MPSKSAQKKVVEPVVAVDVVVDPKKSNAKVAPATVVAVDVVVDSKKSNTKVAPATVVADTPVAKKETKPRTKKEAIPIVGVVVSPVVEVENVVLTESSVDTSITDGFNEFIAKFGNMVSHFSALKVELKGLERKVAKQLKIVEKLQNKKKRKGTRAPSGFVKPSPISDELATFLDKASGTEMARTDVTREINKYIRGKELQDKDNGRIIKADAPLKALLKLDDEVVLTYFNLQKYMSPHFPKQPSTAAVAVVA